MDSVARLTDAERSEVFEITAQQTGLPPAVVEKDFWVCWTLKHIFEAPALRAALLFKGGTALAKASRLVARFSEDVDLAVDYAPLGFTGARDPAAPMSRNKRQELLEELMLACHAYIAGPFMHALKARMTKALGPSSRWSLDVDLKSPNTVVFKYPVAGIMAVPYIRAEILLELGTHAELIPSAEYAITPYAAEQHPQVFKQPTVTVRAIKPERTFWEKATILHVEHHRPPEKQLPSRHARHYYDMAMLARSPVCNVAVADLDLLRRVVEHKIKFYFAGWAKYDLAVPGTLALMPKASRMDQLRRDYESMAPMLFGAPPPLDELLEELARLESRINGTTRVGT